MEGGTRCQAPCATTNWSRTTSRSSPRRRRGTPVEGISVRWRHPTQGLLVRTVSPAWPKPTVRSTSSTIRCWDAPAATCAACTWPATNGCGWRSTAAPAPGRPAWSTKSVMRWSSSRAGGGFLELGGDRGRADVQHRPARPLPLLERLREGVSLSTHDPGTAIRRRLPGACRWTR